ncbi:MAG: ribosome silencing factor [Bacteroidales bacterium]|nr:ribosome silencing factor [Candidatus Sodaliphilus aphodohippi]
MTENENLVKAIVEGIQEKKGKSIVCVDLSGIEYAAAQGFVLCTGNSSMQVDAIADSIREYVEEHTGIRPFNYDGYQNSEWIVIDYGTVYAHVFLPEVKDRYKLEELWSDAKITDIPDID